MTENTGKSADACDLQEVQSALSGCVTPFPLEHILSIPF